MNNWRPNFEPCHSEALNWDWYITPYNMGSLYTSIVYRTHATGFPVDPRMGPIAERIVECVNAFRGIQNPALYMKNSNGGNLQEILNLRNENARLRAELEQAQEKLERNNL